MKKTILLTLCLALLLSLAACAGVGDQPGETKSGAQPAVQRTENKDDTQPAAQPAETKSGAQPAETAAGTQSASQSAGEMPTVLDQTEYVLYQNIFFNNMADDYVGKTFTKEGTLVRLYDAFGERTRYYVWGYMDATKCCDWQWEFVPQDPDSLPANGSLVKMTGTLTRDDAALDKLWFTDAVVELETPFQPEACDVDMTTMDSTLERVQLLNMQYKPDAFAGKTLRFYGRVMNPSTIQHPYYDNAWTQHFTASAEVPAIGTMVILTGTWNDGTVQADRIEPTPDY